MKNAYTLRERATNKWMRRVIREISKNPTDMKAGDKVKFNPDWIANSPFYREMNPARREFVESHKDDIFTLAHDEGKENSNTLFVLEEDKSKEKWLWHAASELIKAEVTE